MGRKLLFIETSKHTTKTVLDDATGYKDDANIHTDEENTTTNVECEKRANIEIENLEVSDAPSVTTIIKFALPAIGIYLCSPLLSMIDTSTVGLLCGTLQQAALNPAVTITDYSARTMSFLYTGTTNSMATSKDSKSREEISEILVGSIRLAALVGAGLSLFLLSSAQRALVPLVGNDTIDPEVLRAAWRYVAIRAFGMPAAAMLGTSQAACLGLQDNQTPFRIIVIAAVLNLVLDVAFVGQKRAWVGGTAGAALATCFSQYFALYLFFRRFTNNKKNLKTNTSGEKGKMSTKGILSGRLSLSQFFRVPPKSTVDDFKPFVIPVTTTQIGRCSTYIAMGHVVSSTMTTVSMAAQQIITSIFYALIPIGDSCSLTAQTYLPAIVSCKPSEERTSAMKATMKNIFKVAGMLGIFLSAIGASLPFICPFLTKDLAVIETVRQIVPIMIGILSTHGIFCASEGILLGFRDLKFLGNIYAVFFVTVPMLMLRLKYAAKGGSKVNLCSVWKIFLGYQAFRILSFLGRVLVLRRQNGSVSRDNNM